MTASHACSLTRADDGIAYSELNHGDAALPGERRERPLGRLEKPTSYMYRKVLAAGGWGRPDLDRCAARTGRPACVEIVPGSRNFRCTQPV